MKKNIKKAQTGQRIRGKSTTLPEGTGTAAAKIIRATQPRRDAAGMQYVGKQIANAMNSPEYKKPEPEPEKRVGPIKRENSTSSSSTSSSSGKGSRAATITSKANTPASSAPAPNRQQKITPKKGLSPIALPERKKPTVAREYSKTERNINEQIEKIKKGEGSTEAAQMKIKALREKERAQQAKSQRQEKRSDMKMLRKSARAGKFNARQVKKSAK